MKKIYTHPEVELVKLSANDVLRTSGYSYDFNEDDTVDNWDW